MKKYRYCTWNCANGDPQVKGVEFYQSYYLVLEPHTIYLVVAIDNSYHLIIGITDFTNAFQNTLNNSHERNIIDSPHHCITWFKLHLPKTCIKPYFPDRRYIMEICNDIQGTKPLVCQWNTILNLLLFSLCLVKYVIDHALYIIQCKSKNGILITR